MATLSDAKTFSPKLLSCFCSCWSQNQLHFLLFLFYYQVKMLETRRIHIKANKHAHQISLQCKRILLIFLAHSEIVNSFILVRFQKIFFILIVLKANMKICKGSVMLTHKNTFMWLIKWIMCP